MPKIRLDQLPLDRRTQARGGQAVVNKREVDPNVVGEIKQRHGSIRASAGDNALGLIAEGKTSYITSEQPIALTGDFTALFNLKWGNLAEDGNYPILTLRAGTTDHHFYQVALNKTGENLIFKIYAQDADSEVTDDSSVLTANSSGGIAFKRTGNALTLELNGADDFSDDLTNITGSIPTGPFYIDLLGTVQGVNSFTDKPTVSGTHPVISNFRLDPSNISVSDNDDESRTNEGNYDYHWKLDGSQPAGFIPADTTNGNLLAIPSPPVVQGGSLKFNGESGGLVIRHTPDLDYYFDTYINSPNTGLVGFQVEGTKAAEATLRDVVLIDYGDLCKLTILGTGGDSGKVKFEMNGTSVTMGTAQFGSVDTAYTFKIFCGREKVGDAYNLSIRCQIGSSTAVTATTVGSVTPFLDYNTIPNIFIGTESSPSSTKRFKGLLTKVAMYPRYYKEDAGDSLAEFAFDLTTESLIDKSPKNRTAELMSHYSRESVDPEYSQGGIADAKYLSVEGGVVLSASGPKNYNSKLTRQLSDQVNSSRLGQFSFLESDGHVHIANREKENARTIGVPKPSRLVTQTSVGGGALNGAYSYGYRYVSDLGTAGPIQRLDPIKTGESARVKLGAPADPELSALGDTYLVCPKDTQSLGVIKADPTDETIAAGSQYPIELYARAGEDMDSVKFKETIWHRGARSNGFHLRSTSNALTFDTRENWTMQYAFKYSRAYHSNYTAICGIGPNGNYWPNNDKARVPDFHAWIDHGNYGGAGGRLVVAAPKKDKYQTVRHKVGNVTSDYLNVPDTFNYLTFSDDAGYWEEGALYNIVFIKSGEKLKVHCQKYDSQFGNTDGSDAVWTTFTGRTDMTRGTTSDTFFFNRDGMAVRTATGFGAGTACRVSAYVPKLTSDGKNHRHLDYQAKVNSTTVADPWSCREMDSPGIIFGLRVWTSAKNLGDFKSYGEDRFCTVSDPTIGRLHNNIFIDLFPHVSDDEQETGVVMSSNDTPTATGFEFRSANGTRLNTFNQFEMSESATSALAPRQVGLCFIGDRLTSSTPFASFDPAAKIFLSDIGNGSLIVQVGAKWGQNSNYLEGRWFIMNRVWNNLGGDNTVSREDLPFVNDWDEFNWISTRLDLDESSVGGTTRSVRLTALVINGNQVFSNSVGGDDGRAGRLGEDVSGTNADGWDDGFIWLGGWGRTSSTMANKLQPVETHIGEFRMWNTNQGPDPTLGTDYKYLAGRASEDEAANLRYYFKFQPTDFTDDTVDTIDDYGTAFTSADYPKLILEDSATLNRLPGAAVTEIAFPDSAHETIAAIDIFRTATSPINDYDIEEDVQTALDIARTTQQYFLAQIPIGTTQYIDNSPDSALGEAADPLSGYIPPGIVSAFVWDSRLVLIDENNRMWPSEVGQLGWESFPMSIPIPNLDTKVTAAINVQGERNQAMVLVLGKSSGTLLTGSPEAPVSHILGGGVGAENRKCLTHYNGVAFAYNGTLWAIQQGQATDFGGPIQELLPTPTNTVLRTSAKLSSLFVIDKTTGVCLRYHFPTGQWTVEERYASTVGDLEDGSDVWISKEGPYATGSTTVYGDDVRSASTPSSHTHTINTSSKVFTSSSDLSANLHTLMPVTIVDSAGNTVGTHITAINGVSITVASVSGLTAGSSTAATMYFGAGESGLLLDTGPMDVGDDSVISPKLLVDNLTGTGWEYAVHATKHPGDRDVLPTLTYTTMSTASGYRASGVRGRFQRVVIRNRKREAAQIPLLEIDLS